MSRAQNEPLAAESVAGATAAGVSASVADRAAVSLADAAASGAGMRIVSCVSSGGMQLESSQIIHSTSAATLASGAVSRTRWAKRALPEKVPICMSNVAS